MAVTVVDDTPTPDARKPGMSDLARLRKDAEAYSPKPLRYAHPTLPQYVLVFRHDLDWEEMDRWRKRCVIKVARNGRNEEIDSAKFNRMIVSGTNIGIEHRDNLTEAAGQPMLDSRGDPVSFTNKEFMAEFGVATAADAVKAFIISDPGIASLANKIIDDNGVGADVEELPDPTDGDVS